MNFLIAADLVPTKSNIELFNNGNVKELLGENFFSIWKSADIRIFNLEVPLVDKDNPIDKCGPNLITPTSTIKGIKSLNPNLITLANNHIMDQGILGLNSTRNLLNKYNIPYVGVGDNLFEARKPYIITKDGLNIGVYACAEHEFSIAEENKPGANPFDPLESLDHIYKLKKECDYVIVLYHGGKEHYRYPSPYLQKVCRKMVEKGADLVVAQHSHCIGCYENYNGAKILYGQGNFIFDSSNNEFWKTSLILKVDINKNGLSVDYIPISKVGNSIRVAQKKEGDKILNNFYKRSIDILTDGFIERKYDEFARENLDNYLRTFAGYGKLISRIDRYLLRGLLIKRKFNNKKLLKTQNYIKCEAHRELVLAGLKGEKHNEGRES